MQSLLRDEEMSIESRNFIGSLRPLVLFRKDCAVSWHQLHLFVITRAEWKCQNLTHGEGSCKMFVIILTVYAWVSLYHSFSSSLIQSSKGYRKTCCKNFVNPPNAPAVSTSVIAFCLVFHLLVDGLLSVSWPAG